MAYPPSVERHAEGSPVGAEPFVARPSGSRIPHMGDSGACRKGGARRMVLRVDGVRVSWRTYRVRALSDDDIRRERGQFLRVSTIPFVIAHGTADIDLHVAA